MVGSTQAQLVLRQKSNMESGTVCVGALHAGMHLQRSTEHLPSQPKQCHLSDDLLCHIIALMNPGSVALGIRDQRGSMAFKSLRAAAEKMTTHTDIHVRPSPETPQDLSSLQHKLSRMPKLTEVALEWDRRGWDPPVLHGIGLILATLPGLTSLQVPESLPDETVLPLLLHLSALQHLDLNSYDLLEVQTLQTVSQLTGLRTLTLHQPIRKGGKNLNWCSKLTLLQELYLTTHCTELSALSLIVSLQKLALKNYSGHSVESLSNLLSLEHLNLSGAACLRSVAPLGDLTKLVDLNLSCCKKLRCLGNLSGLSRLTSLNLHGCTGFRTPLLLSGMVVLVRLIYSNMGRHVVLQNNYDSLVTLTHLDLSCNHLAGMDLASLSPLTNLKSLRLAFCCEVGDICALSILVGLTSLDLRNSWDISEQSLEAVMLALTQLRLSKLDQV